MSYLTALPDLTSKHRDIRFPTTSVVPGEYVEENHLGTVYKEKTWELICLACPLLLRSYFIVL